MQHTSFSNGSHLLQVGDAVGDDDSSSSAEQSSRLHPNFSQTFSLSSSGLVVGWVQHVSSSTMVHACLSTVALVLGIVVTAVSVGGNVVAAGVTVGDSVA